jgi:hypothetical protein
VDFHNMENSASSPEDQLIHWPFCESSNYAETPVDWEKFNYIKNTNMKIQLQHLSQSAAGLLSSLPTLEQTRSRLYQCFYYRHFLPDKHKVNTCSEQFSPPHTQFSPSPQ